MTNPKQISLPIREIAVQYSKRFGYMPPMLPADAAPATAIIIVIPCHNENHMISTLDSLINCTIPENVVMETIIMINSVEGSVDEIMQQNEKTEKDVQEWIGKQQNENHRFHLLIVNDMPPKVGGVGLARKIGMDEALCRFGKINKDGIILCLDADCTVQPNYLLEIFNAFEQDHDAGCASIYFEHPLKAAPNPHLLNGIIQYELHLRYYVLGLRTASYPNAFHTVGSSMAVKASVYGRHGGMNKRKAGEDFYFLHKLAPHVKHIEITNTTVYPSPRISDRVPFGTGKAMELWMERREDTLQTYDPRVYSDLAKLVAVFEAFDEQKLEDLLLNLPDQVHAFLISAGFDKEWNRIQSNSSESASRKKHLFRWLDGFKVLKLIHFLTEKFYPKMPVRAAAILLLNTTLTSDHQKLSEKELLFEYRKLDRRDSG